MTAEQVANAVEELLLDYQLHRDAGFLIHGLFTLVERVRS